MNDGRGKPWEFFLLKNLKIVHRGQELKPLTGRWKRGLLAFLLLHPGTHDRATVAGRIWPGDADSDALRKLRQTLKDLNDELGDDLGDVVVASRTQIGVPEGVSVWVDVHSVEELIENADVEAAVDLTEAELMPEISSEWIDAARVRHQATVVSQLEHLSTRAELRGDLDVALRFTSRWVDLCPHVETPRRELLRRLAKAEEFAGASAAATDLLTLLRDLGLQPSKETRAVLASLHQVPEAEPKPLATSRDALLVRLGAGDERIAIQAAQALAAAALTCSEGTPCLPLTAAADVDATEPCLRIRTVAGSQREVRLSLPTVRDLLADPDRFLTSVLCQLFDLSEDNLETASSLVARIRELPAPRETRGTVVSTERVSEVIGRLQAGADVAMIGPSAAGKTVSAEQIVQQLTGAGWTVSWIDLSDPAAGAIDLLVSLAVAKEGPAASHLIVLDDLQANPGVAIQIGNLLAEISQAFSSRLGVVLLGWDSARQLANEVCPGAVTIPCSGEDLLRPVLEGLACGEVEDAVLSQVRRLSAGDLLVANEAFQHYLRTGEVPSLRQIASATFEELTGGEPLSAEATRLAFLLAALGQFEIDAARAFAEAQSQPALEELVARRIIRPVGPFVAVGHRSHAALIVLHLRAGQPELMDSLGSPVRLSLEYLRAAGDGQIVAMLQRLDLASAARRESDQHGSTFLARSWESIQILRNYLRRQVQRDATWGDNVASAIHAAQTFSRFDEEAWSTTARFVRSRWLVDGGKLPEPRGQSSRERDDFTAIEGKMAEEDAVKQAENAPVEMTAASIDFDRVHRTWVLGQLLGFEASAPGRSSPPLEDLVAVAGHVQEPDGNFYPSRVPWVTARVVLGLVAAGHTASSSPSVKQACQWLRRPYPEGPYKAGAWEGGTGTWNSTVETTAMCLSALARAGIPLDDPAIKAGRAYLLSQRAAWVQPGAEVDAANALEAYILTGGRWREVSAELMHLLSWARDKEPWTRTSHLASESQAQSSAVALVANSLVGILWATVKAELPILLEGIATEREAPMELAMSLSATDEPG